MLYYLGKGTEFKKDECKEYKTLKNALAATAKDEALTVWDENGAVVGGLTNNVPEGALNTDPDGSVNAYDESGEKKNDGGQQDSVSIPQGSKKVTVVCDGALNLRRSPGWGNENICGRAVRGQTYYIDDICVVDGKKMVKTIDGIFMSAAPEHVKFS